ncbi:MAG: DUF4157 domain-containing protein [Acidobacteria bacterium]|nr:DUF4157 domain-containing protein [Acidobacteriota bacterium]
MQHEAAQECGKSAPCAARPKAQAAPLRRLPATAGNALLRLQWTQGNRYVQRMLKSGALQRECACGGSCSACSAAHDEEQHHKDEQRRLDEAAEGHNAQAAPASPAVAPPIIHEVLRSAGEPLGESVRADMEQSFGVDFGNVRVHTGSRAAESANAVGALAYTVGQDVVFANGQYAPETQHGRSILAHELTHTLQQRAGYSGPAPDAIEIGEADSPAEAEADRVADTVVSGKNAPVMAQGDPPAKGLWEWLFGPSKKEEIGGCDAASKVEKMTACIQPYVIADDDGKSATTAPSFTETVNIWAKCCIDYTINATKQINKTAYKTLEESPSNTPSAEETSLFNDAGASACIQVFVPQTFSQGVDTGKHISGGGGTYDAGKANPKIVVVEGAVGEVVAHEVGHASGYTGHDASNTVMKPTGAHNKANSSNVSADVCTRARSGAVLTKGGSKDCCMTT